MKRNRRSIRLNGYNYSEPGYYFITICTFKGHHLFGDIVLGEMKLNDIGKITDRCWNQIPNHFTNTVLHSYIIMPNHIHGIIQITNSNHAPNTKKYSNPVWTNHHSPNDPTNHTPNSKKYSNPVGANHYSPNASNHHSPNIPTNHSPNIPKSNSPNETNMDDNTGVKDVSPLRIGDNDIKMDMGGKQRPYGTSKTIGSIVRGFKIGVTKWCRKNTKIYLIWHRNYWDHIIRNEEQYMQRTHYIKNNPRKWHQK